MKVEAMGGLVRAARPIDKTLTAWPFFPSRRIQISTQRFLRNPPYRLRSRAFTTTSSAISTTLPPKPTFFRRAATFFAIGLTVTTIGFAMTASPALPAVHGLINLPSDEETLSLYQPSDPIEREVEDHINNCWVARELRAKPEFTELRPHMKIPPAFRESNLTANTLLGPGKVVVPPFAWVENEGKSLVSVSYLGTDLCGHPGIVHGGFLATMLDEGMARCSMRALPHHIAMTANLNINYRAPAPAASYVVLRATTTRVEGRKAWVDGRIETLAPRGEKPVLLAEATGLFVSPKHAAAMTNLFNVTN